MLQGSNSIPVNVVQFAEPDPVTGDISSWNTVSAPLSSNPGEGLYLMAAVAVPEINKVYIMGGRQSPGSGPAVAKVFSGSPNSTGDITQWVQEDIKDLPEPLLRHSAVFAPNGSIYVVGGQNTTSGDHRKNVFYLPTMDMNKSSTVPHPPLSEGDVLTYHIDYKNTSLITHTISITDILPWNTHYVPNSATPEAILDDNKLNWVIFVPPGTSGQVSFQAKVPLLPNLDQPSPMASLLATNPNDPAYILPVSIACDTTRFWANGVTRQPPIPNPHTIKIQIPPGSNPSMMWLLMKTTQNSPPEVEGIPAMLEKINENEFGASLWSAPITSAMLAAGEVTIITRDPRNLNAVFLFDADDPPFDQAVLDVFFNTTKPYSYTLDIPSVTTQTIDIILPFMDITYLTDNSPPLPDTRKTSVTVQFDGQSHTIRTDTPNLGNGLFIAQFPFEIGPLDSEVVTKTVAITVSTENSVYTLGPRICRPVYIENTAWLCSEQAGCISDTVRNVPGNFVPPSGRIYFPFILKSS